MKIEDHRIFSDHMDTLKEMSKDTSQGQPRYMTERMEKAVNFDLVKRAYTNALALSEETASSCDSLALLPTGPVLIEFKNGKVSSAKVKTKIRDSLLIYGGITGQSIANTRTEMEFVLVYNEQKNPDRERSVSTPTLDDAPSRVTIAAHLANRAHTEHIRFDLERFQKLYFVAVHTYTPEEFEKYLAEKGLA